MAASIRPGEDSGGVFVDCNSNGPPVILKTEPVVEDKNENGQAGQYFVDKVTGEYYFRSSNGDLEQLLAADMEAGEITDTDENQAREAMHHEDLGCPDQDLEDSHKVEPKLLLKEELVQVEVKKKRGRPVGWRKYQTPSDADPDLTTGNPPDEQVVVKKKRGRPRKSKPDSDSSVLLEEGVDDHYEAFSTSVDDEVVKLLAADMEAGEITDMDENQARVAMHHEDIGCPDQDLEGSHKVEPKLLLKEEPVQVEVKKRRGRPVGWRKYQTPPDADPDPITGPPDEQGVVKKKRGRPRKNKLDSDSSVLLAEGEDDQYEEVSTSTRSVIVPFSLKKF